MHGILDTSMGWVSNGVTGSQAFAAYDQGFDVWLGNSRANPPRKHERESLPKPSITAINPIMSNLLLEHGITSGGIKQVDCISRRWVCQLASVNQNLH